MFRSVAKESQLSKLFCHIRAHPLIIPPIRICARSHSNSSLATTYQDNRPHQVNMGITELIFPTYKPDPNLQAELEKAGPEIFKQFHGTEGLLSLFRGKILVDDGNPVDPKSGRSLLVLGSSPFELFLLL